MLISALRGELIVGQAISFPRRVGKEKMSVTTEKLRNWIALTIGAVGLAAGMLGYSEAMSSQERASAALDAFVGQTAIALIGELPDCVPVGEEVFVDVDPHNVRPLTIRRVLTGGGDEINQATGTAMAGTIEAQETALADQQGTIVALHATVEGMEKTATALATNPACRVSTETPTPSNTPTPSETPTSSRTPTPSRTPTWTATWTRVVETATATWTRVQETATATWTRVIATLTPTPSSTPTEEATPSPAGTNEQQPSATAGTGTPDTTPNPATSTRTPIPPETPGTPPGTPEGTPAGTPIVP